MSQIMWQAGRKFTLQIFLNKHYTARAILLIVVIAQLIQLQPLQPKQLTTRPIAYEVPPQKEEFQYLEPQAVEVVAPPVTEEPTNIIIESTGLSPVVINTMTTLAAYYGTYSMSLQLAMIDKETGGTFNPYSLNVNSNGTRDYGLHQFNDGGTAQWVFQEVYPSEAFSAEKLFDPVVSVTMGAWYLNYCLTRQSGDMHRALTAYNRGEDGLRTYERRYQTPCTNYSQDIVQRESQYSELVEQATAQANINRQAVELMVQVPMQALP